MGHFSCLNLRLCRSRNGKSKNQKEAKIILQQPNHRFNHRIEETVLAEKIISESPMFQKSLGGTNYKVYIHFSQSSKENFEDKILRLLTCASELVQIAERRQM